jgi:hypothetical protein
MENRDTAQHILNLIIRMSGQLCAATALLFPGNKSGTPWISGKAGLIAGFDATEKREISPLQRIEPRFPH